MPVNFRRRSSSRFQCGSTSCHFSASIGVAIFPLDGRQQQELEEKADKAMYLAKKRGIPVALDSLEEDRCTDPGEAAQPTGLGIAQLNRSSACQPRRQRAAFVLALHQVHQFIEHHQRKPPDSAALYR